MSKIYIWRYGYIPEQDNSEQRSITELEYHKNWLDRWPRPSPSGLKRN